MSSAPSFGAPGGHIFDVVAQGLKTHVFTVMHACYSTMLELPELLVFPIPSLIDNTGFLIIHRG